MPAYAKSLPSTSTKSPAANATSTSKNLKTRNTRNTTINLLFAFVVFLVFINIFVVNSFNRTPQSERIHIALFGRRNAGKSSLINALTGQHIALVSDVPGTTT
ncbi:MAG: 50S ribosome-binding GTPase, partial [Muribaculaceae bacterium]|nr:50S ribosome-binding GTPase [Muribaculaceae bacterium]